jgi:iron(III) transport system ATP-binding protein
MSVFENAAYPLRVSRTKRFSRTEIVKKTNEILERVGLGNFASRSATQLSGGQQQRLALARALAREPRLLLLDEPLSNLDAQLREQMRIELKRLQRETGVTAVYVTHDQAEALAISDRIAVMRDGRIVQVGTPKEIYDRPNSEFIARFVGRSNLLRGVLAGPAKRGESAMVRTTSGDILCLFTEGASAGSGVSVLVRPESITIAKSADQNAGNCLSGTVVHETYLGEAVEYLISAAGTEFLVRAPSQGINPGDDVMLVFSPQSALALRQ